MSNTGPNGSLNQDSFLRAMLQLRNTPDPDCNVSPAQVVFGRPLRDAFSFVNRLEKFSNPNIRPIWRDAWAAKEDALRTRMTRTTEEMTKGSRPLRPLRVGEHVFLQNQHGSHPNKWDRSGVVMEALGHEQYCVKVDGTGRITNRNRRFLRAFQPATLTIGTRAPVPQLRRLEAPSSLSTPDAHPPGSPETRRAQPEPERHAQDTQLAPSLNPCSDPVAPPDAQRAPRNAELPPADAIQTPPGPRRSARKFKPAKVYEPETGCWRERTG